MTPLFHPLQLGYYLDHQYLQISEWRQRLGGYLAQQVVLTADEWTDLFPFVSNVWLRHDGHVDDKPSVKWPYKKQQYRCRFFRGSKGTKGEGKINKFSTSVTPCKTSMSATIRYKVDNNIVTEDVETVSNMCSAFRLWYFINLLTLF